MPTFCHNLRSYFSSTHSYVNKKFHSFVHFYTTNNNFKFFLASVWVILYAFCNYIRYCFRFICYNFYALTQNIGSIIIPYDIVMIRENQEGKQFISSICVPNTEYSSENVQNLWSLVNVKYNNSASKYNFVLQNSKNIVIQNQPLEIEVDPKLCLIVR